MFKWKYGSDPNGNGTDKTINAHNKNTDTHNVTVKVL